MKKRKKKKLKGMSLAEVLVALAIFALMSSLVAVSVAFVCNVTGKTTRLTKRISNEGPKAELKDGGVKGSDSEMTVKFEGDSKSYVVKYDEYVVSDDPDNDYDGGNFKYINPKSR